jgi:hypothetical protein
VQLAAEFNDAAGKTRKCNRKDWTVIKHNEQAVSIFFSSLELVALPGFSVSISAILVLPKFLKFRFSALFGPHFLKF